MIENWLEIVASLAPCFSASTKESEYQHEIEGCLKILGWKKSNGTMESQVPVPIGNNNTIRPDILLYKHDEQGQPIPVLPIEIKRPDNTANKRQALQLMSYMRQLRLN